MQFNSSHRKTHISNRAEEQVHTQLSDLDSEVKSHSSEDFRSLKACASLRGSLNGDMIKELTSSVYENFKNNLPANLGGKPGTMKRAQSYFQSESANQLFSASDSDISSEDDSKDENKLPKDIKSQKVNLRKSVEISFSLKLQRAINLKSNAGEMKNFELGDD